MKSLRGPEPVQTAAEPGPPTNYIDLYGLSKAPFGDAADNDFILFAFHRRPFELLVEHLANGSGLVVLIGQEGIGKTETLRAASKVAAEAGVQSVLVRRPPGGRIDLGELTKSIGRAPEAFHQSPRMALSADDIELMPNECIGLLLSLVRAVPVDTPGSAIAVTCSEAAISRPDLADLVGLAKNTHSSAAAKSG